MAASRDFYTEEAKAANEAWARFPYNIPGRPNSAAKSPPCSWSFTIPSHPTFETANRSKEINDLFGYSCAQDLPRYVPTACNCCNSLYKAALQQYEEAIGYVKRREEAAYYFEKYIEPLNENVLSPTSMLDPVWIKLLQELEVARIALERCTVK